MTLTEGIGQLSLVALYGEKNHYPELWELMQELQSNIITILGEGSYEPYSEQRIHATIVGLEGYRMGREIYNRNAYKKLGQLRAVQLELVVDFLLESSDLLPLPIQIGGFQEGNTYQFTSQGRHPYLRSFSIQRTIAVAMGWPCENGHFTSRLDSLRRAFNMFNVFHKYHDSDDAYDNDFFFVLGNVLQGLNADLITKCETQMREILSQTCIPPIRIGIDELKVVAYAEGDTTFQNATVMTLDEAKRRIRELERFYVANDCDS